MASPEGSNEILTTTQAIWFRSKCPRAVSMGGGWDRGRTIDRPTPCLVSGWYDWLHGWSRRHRNLCGNDFLCLNGQWEIKIINRFNSSTDSRTAITISRYLPPLMHSPRTETGWSLWDALNGQIYNSTLR